MAGGGTGGHITPILTIAKALKKAYPQIELIYFGDHSEITTKLTGDTDMSIKRIYAGKFRRFSSRWYVQIFAIKQLILNLADIPKTIFGFFQSLWMLHKIKPSAVFVKGGFVGLPVGLAAWVLGIPLIIHESDVSAGITNRILAPLAAKIAVSFPKEYFKNWRKYNLFFTGNPIRDDLFDNPHRLQSAFSNIKSEKPVLLVVGGSRGSEAINNAIWSNLSSLKKNWEIIHVVGAKQAVPMRAQKTASYHPFDFLGKEMGEAYAKAKVVVCRGGMSTLSEIAAFGKPAVVVPHPQLPRNHQVLNVKVFEKEDAAVVIEQTELEKSLPHVLADLAKNPKLLQALSNRIKKLAKPHADREIAKLIYQASKP